MLSKDNPALVLNADFRPLSYFPLSLWNWQDAVKAVVLDRVNVVAQYDDKVHSPSFEMHLPSVIALKEFVTATRRPAFTRFNVFLRDHFTCQYCGAGFPSPELTFDHVVPRSRGGLTVWHNVVTACEVCNLRKGSRTLRDSSMRMLTKPVEPTHYQLQDHGRCYPPNFLHQSWKRLPVLGYRVGDRLELFAFVLHRPAPLYHFDVVSGFDPLDWMDRAVLPGATLAPLYHFDVVSGFDPLDWMDRAVLPGATLAPLCREHLGGTRAPAALSWRRSGGELRL